MTSADSVNFIPSILSFPYITVAELHRDVIAGYSDVLIYVETFGYGGLCDEGWDDNDASVICRDYGFDYGIAFYNG